MKLKTAIEQSHQCHALHRQTVRVREEFQGQTAWESEVEVFEVQDHPKSTHCFAWLAEEDQHLRPVALLSQWLVNSPQTAVRMAIVLGLPIKMNRPLPALQ